MYQYVIHDSKTASVLTDSEGFIVAYLSATENSQSHANLERMTKLLARAEDLEEACQATLAALQNPDFDEYFDANNLERQITQALGEDND